MARLKPCPFEGFVGLGREEGFWVGRVRAKAEALGYLEAWPARLSCRGGHPDLQVRETPPRIGGTRFACAFDLGGFEVCYPTHPQRTPMNGAPKMIYRWATRRRMLLKAKCGDVHHRGDNAMDYQGFTRLIDDPVWAGG